DENGAPRFVRWVNDELIEWIYFSPDVAVGANGIWGLASDDIWALAGLNRHYHWDGNGWSAEYAGPIESANEIHGYGPDDYWLIAYNEGAHWDGSSWTTYNFAWGNSGAFWGFSGGEDAWATEFSYELGGIRRLQDGYFKYWSDSPLDGDGKAIWGTSASDVWLAGTSMVHYDGNAWTRVPFDGYPDSVWAASETDAWAGDQHKLHHWDGVSWTLHTALLDSGPMEINRIWGSAPDDIWATGIYTEGQDKGYLYHYDGVSWTKYPYLPDLSSNHYTALWGLTADYVWLGSYLSDEYWIFDGFGWVESTESTSIRNIWGTDPFNIRVVTWGPSIERYNPMLQDFEVEYYDPLGGNPRTLWGKSSTDIWALGEHHFFMRYDGNSWTVSDGPVVEEQQWRTEEIRVMWGIDGSYFAAGQSGLILQRP
ncbi:MAG TPA: hypothetical protein VM869_01200, partial [Enhygromyxa sp.]|nr:hypothetical protein [Enhygromyxa sp.]